MNDLQDLIAHNALVGALLPLLIAVIQQPRWSNPVRSVVTLVLCLAAGALVAYQSGRLTGQGFGYSATTVLLAAWATYTHFWKPTNIAPVVELLTSAPGQVLSAMQMEEATSAAATVRQTPLPTIPSPPADDVLAAAARNLSER